MARSLFRLLRGLSGRRHSGATLLELGAAKRRQLYHDRLLPGGLSAEALGACETLPQFRVAVVGGGFAGLAAAWYLRQCGIGVTVFEAGERLGGRVLTDYNFIAGKYVEAGAELIGINHPMWIELSAIFGLQLIEVTSEDWYERAGQEVRLRFGDRNLTDAERKQLELDLEPVIDTLGHDARNIDPVRPWLSPNADSYDRMSVAQRFDQIFGSTSSTARYALELTLGNDNCAPVSQQSYLGLLALVSAGRVGNDTEGMRGYWEYTETHRCWSGNQQLAAQLAAGLPDVRLSSPVAKITINEETGVGISVGGAAPLEEAFDYAVLAAPPTSWPAVESSYGWTPADWTMSHGPAVKHLNAFDTQFWAPQGLAPLAIWDRLGSVWEGTDGQPATHNGFDLSVYSGGTYVQPEPEYRAKLAQLYPGYAPTAIRFMDWPNTPYIWTGYSVPSPGQVCSVGRALSTPYATRMYFAGEQSCVGFFGYMEGALQSGARAARDIVAAICPAAV